MHSAGKRNGPMDAPGYRLRPPPLSPHLFTKNFVQWGLVLFFFFVSWVADATVCSSRKIVLEQLWLWVKQQQLMNYFSDSTLLPITVKQVCRIFRNVLLSCDEPLRLSECFVSPSVFLHVIFFFYFWGVLLAYVTSNFWGVPFLFAGLLSPFYQRAVFFSSLIKN